MREVSVHPDKGVEDRSSLCYRRFTWLHVNLEQTQDQIPYGEQEWIIKAVNN